MTERGYYKRRDPGTLKEAEADLIAANGGPVAAADKCDVGKSVLQAASDKDHPKRHLTIKTVADLERACRKPIVSGFLLAELGYVAEPMGGACIDSLPVVLGRITSEMGQLLSAVAVDVEAGTLTRANAGTILRETDDVIAALLKLRAAARDVRDRVTP